jgi:hypothetical protein
VPGDSRDSVSDQDIAIVTAKEKLVALKDRAGYNEAMTVPVPSGIGRAICVAAAACCGGLMYACKLYVTAAWLMWMLVALFGVLGLFFLLATIGFSPKLAGQKWGVAVVGKHLDGDKHRIKFLRESGEEHDLLVSEQIYGLLRPGDLGVLHASGNAPDYTVDSFTRL